MTSSFMLDVMGSIKFVEIYSNKSHFMLELPKVHYVGWTTWLWIIYMIKYLRIISWFLLLH